jgi:hypothetical protein
MKVRIARWARKLSASAGSGRSLELDLDVVDRMPLTHDFNAV